MKVHNPVKRAAANHLPAGAFFLKISYLSLIFSACHAEEEKRASPFEGELWTRVQRCLRLCRRRWLHKQMTICFSCKLAGARRPPDAWPTYTLWQYWQRSLESSDHPEIYQNTRRRHHVFFFLKTTAFNLIPTLLSVHGYKRWSDLACLEPPDQKSIKLVHMQPRSNYVRPALPSLRRHNTPFIFFCVQVRAQDGL